MSGRVDEVHCEDKRDALHETRKNTLSSIEIDAVHFTAFEFFAEETEGKATIDVMRVGALGHSCSVSYRTEDCSAIAGQRYKHAEGELCFEGRETFKTFEVQLIQDPVFDTTLEFSVVLENPVNCILSGTLARTRVLVIDDDRFPSDEIADQVLDPEGSVHAGGLGVQLLIAWMKFAYKHIPTIWWKSLLTVFLVQLHNVYYLASIYVRVYFVDMILNTQSDIEASLLIPNDRKLSAIVLALAWAAPNILLLILDFSQVGPLDMGFGIRKYLRVNLFRTYMNYTDHSFRLVPVHDLTLASNTLIPTIVDDGYLFVFGLLQSLGKLVCVAGFILRKDVSSALPLLIFPLVMLAYAYFTQTKRYDFATCASAEQEITQTLLVQASLSNKLISSYKRRATVVDSFEDRLASQRAVTISIKKFEFWSEQVVPWLTWISLGLYLVYGSFQVLDDRSSVGIFLATLGAYKDLGELFELVHRQIQDALCAIEPLTQMVKFLNLRTDLEDRLIVNRKRRRFVQEMLQNLKHEEVPDKYFWDNIRINFNQISIEHIPSLQRVHLKVYQDTITLVSGPHGCGKFTLMNTFTKSNLTKGDVLFPPFLFCLPLPQEPSILTYKSLLENLCFGRDQDLENTERVRHILSQLLETYHKKNLKKHWLLEHFDADAVAYKMGTLDERNKKELLNMDDQRNPVWYSKLSHNEMKRISMVRAFVHSPNIMILHKPFDDVDPDTVDVMLKMLREFVKCRGLGTEDSEQSWQLRHPRTIFLTTGRGAPREKILQCVDAHWSLDDGYLKLDAGSHNPGSQKKRTCKL